jgi:hypothetical protein
MSLAEPARRGCFVPRNAVARIPIFTHVGKAKFETFLSDCLTRVRNDKFERIPIFTHVAKAKFVTFLSDCFARAQNDKFERIPIFTHVAQPPVA